MLTFRDYHPFLHVRTLMESIAAQAGYSIRSDFMETDFVGSLYISGRYPEKETSLLTGWGFSPNDSQRFLPLPTASAAYTQILSPL